MNISANGNETTNPPSKFPIGIANETTTVKNSSLTINLCLSFAEMTSE
ncbi:hypothetical protein B0O79_2917 [Flavobacteriaceae bacterium MAR_2009_75]|nr:hypothetical protein B0O79_2917 [Flavobacteriaceae bacterium MAR_2009_75]